MASWADRAVPTPAPYRVVHRTQETADVWTLELVPLDSAVDEFAPGQFSMLYAFGAGEAPISVSGDLDSGGPLTHTIRAVGAVTRALCAVPVGGTVGVRGPYGVPWPVERAAGCDVVVVAGGLGLAPLRPVVYELLRHRERYGRVAVLCGARSPGELLFAEEMERWRARFDVTVDATVDVPAPGWRGRVGLVTKLLRRADFDPENAIGFVCGPEIMMRVVVEGLAARGLSPENLWVSLERSMKCATGHCGHCMLGPYFVCKDGPVWPHAEIGPLMAVPGL